MLSFHLKTLNMVLADVMYLMLNIRQNHLRKERKKKKKNKQKLKMKTFEILIVKHSASTFAFVAGIVDFSLLS